MAEMATGDILQLIQDNGGPEGLDLSGKDLQGIVLDGWTIQLEASQRGLQSPIWRASDTRGINLKKANLYKANLKSAEIWKANLESATLGEANLESADVSESNLESASLAFANLASANLRHTNLRSANLWLARAECASFWNANLQSASLVMCDLRGADLRAANLREAQLHGAMLDQTQLDRASLGDKLNEESSGQYDHARDAYLRLKHNFESLGNYSDAAWAYHRERLMEKYCNAPWNARICYGASELGETSEWHPRAWWFHIRHTLKWGADGCTEYLCGFGENPWLVLFWIGALLLGSALLYWLSGGVTVSSPDSTGATSIAFTDAFLYALASLVTMEGKYQGPANPAIEAIPQLQAAIGIFLLGLLGFVAANKIRRS